MIRITGISGKYYGIEVEDVYEDSENIQNFIDSEEVVILVSSLDDLEYSGLGIDAEDIKMVGE